MRTLKHVMQKNRNSGCGPAVVATLAGLTFEAGCLVMFPDGRRRDLGSDYPLLRRTLTRLTIAYAPTAKRTMVWGEIPALSVVSTTRNGLWHHWVIYDPESQLVYDPQFPTPTPVLLSRQRPLSYLTVSLDDMEGAAVTIPSRMEARKKPRRIIKPDRNRR